MSIVKSVHIYESLSTDRYNEVQFLQSSDRVDTAIWIHHMDANKTDGEKA